MLGQLLDGRRAPQRLAQAVGGVTGLEVELLHAARDPYRPTAVAKVLLERSDDRGRGEGGKAGAEVGVVPGGRLDETHGRHLYQVLQRFAPVGEASSQVPGQTEVILHQPAVDGL